MTALFLATPKKQWLRWIAILYACYIGIGVSLSIHWFSEFVAGTLIGIAVGRAVEETLGKKTPEVLYLGHMKNSIIAIGIVLLLAGGAYVYVTKHRLSTTGTTTSTASSTPVIPIAKPNTTSIHITKVDKVPANASSQLTYKGTGTDSIAFEVKGSIKNVKLVKVALDGPQLSIKDTIKEFGSISNNTLYITTTIPQEVPAEMLTWQSDKGLNYSWIIGTNGTTGSVDRTYNAIE